MKSILTELRREWFVCGQIMYCSYWMHYYKILHYGEGNDSRIDYSDWSVTVITCEKDGTPIQGKTERTHCTEISQKDVELTMKKIGKLKQ